MPHRVGDAKPHLPSQRMKSEVKPWTVAELLRVRAQVNPGSTFLETVNGKSQSYAQVWLDAKRMANVLRNCGVQKGDTVVIMMRNGLDAVQAWFGTNALGAIDVTINTGYCGAPFTHALNQAHAKYLIVGAEFLPVLKASKADLLHLTTVLIVGEKADACDPDGILYVDCVKALASAPDDIELPTLSPSDIASIIYTSGTSGPAKGVLMPYAQVMLLAQQTADNLRIRSDDVYYSFHPLYHMAGKFMQVLACAAVGAKLVLDEAFAPQHWLQRVRESGATLSGAHGPMLEMIFAQPPTSEDRNHKLRTICSAPFPRHIAAAFEQRFNTRGIEVWGMTEVGIPLWCSLDEPMQEGSCGRVDRKWFDFSVVDPATDDPVPVGEIGEFVVRPKHPWTLMQGYVGMPEKTVESWRNLWFHTSDSGYMDDAGNVYFIDRTSDRIRRRAENISSYDIEIAALRYPDVAEVAAVGTASEYAGDDDIRLCVVCKQGAQPEAIDLLCHLATLLPHFMVPRYIEFMDALPRSATQKVQRAELRKRPHGPAVWDRKAHGIALRDLKETT